MHGETAERFYCIIYTQEEFFIGVGQFDISIYYGADGSFFDGLADEGMTVEVCACYGEKAVAGIDGTRVCGYRNRTAPPRCAGRNNFCQVLVRIIHFLIVLIASQLILPNIKGLIQLFAVNKEQGLKLLIFGNFEQKQLDV